MVGQGLPAMLPPGTGAMMADASRWFPSPPRGGPWLSAPLPGLPGPRGGRCGGGALRPLLGGPAAPPRGALFPLRPGACGRRLPRGRGLGTRRCSVGLPRRPTAPGRPPPARHQAGRDGVADRPSPAPGPGSAAGLDLGGRPGDLGPECLAAQCATGLRPGGRDRPDRGRPDRPAVRALVGEGLVQRSSGRSHRKRAPPPPPERHHLATRRRDGRHRAACGRCVDHGHHATPLRPGPEGGRRGRGAGADAGQGAVGAGSQLSAVGCQ
jgi:hypothetical protein